MMFATEAHKYHYYQTIQDFNEIMVEYGTERVLDDLKILDLTMYEDLVKIVMRADGFKKKTAALLRDPYFDANQN